ncbi:hypothetical protein GCM10007342_16910 [Staphylococcus pragensis]|nr:hypothetical protein GCM10007342_16910 [Staphylococcus pragensis]
MTVVVRKYSDLYFYILLTSNVIQKTPLTISSKGVLAMIIQVLGYVSFSHIERYYKAQYQSK